MRDTGRAREALAVLVRSSAFRDCFEDGGPQWREGKTRSRPCQTAEEAAEETRGRVRALRRHGAGEPGAMRLANHLETRPHCPSGASPEFMRAFQRYFVREFVRFLRHSERDWSIVSAIYSRSGALMGNLGPRMFDRLEDRATEALHAAGISCALGGFDLSANEHELEAFRPHYRPQVWFAAPTSEVRGGERVLRNLLPPGTLVLRPVRIKRWDGYAGGIAYGIKPNFDRRISLVEGNTRKVELRAAQKVEIALATHRAGPMSRLFLYGLDLQIDEQRNVVISRC